MQQQQQQALFAHDSITKRLSINHERMNETGRYEDHLHCLAKCLEFLV